MHLPEEAGGGRRAAGGGGAKRGVFALRCVYSSTACAKELVFYEVCVAPRHAS